MYVKENVLFFILGDKNNHQKYKQKFYQKEKPYLIRILHIHQHD